jgi:hypothetical protein
MFGVWLKFVLDKDSQVLFNQSVLILLPLFLSVVTNLVNQILFCLQVHPGGRRLLVQCRSLSHPVAMIDLKLNAIMQTFSGCQSFKRQVNPSVCLFVSLFVSFFCFFFFVSFDARPQVKLDHENLLRMPKFQTTG